MSSVTDPRPQLTEAQAGLDRAVDYLRGLQDEAGWWQGELETNVTMDAEDLLLREFLGIRTGRETAAAARWIRSKQRADGTWATFCDGPADLSTTVEAWVALRLAGDDPAAEHMQLAATFIVASGGVPATRVFTKIWLALFGLWPWEQLPVMPPELIFLPRWAPLNIYNWGCWARQTIVPMTIVQTKRPVRTVSFDLAELSLGAEETPSSPTAQRRRRLSWHSVFQTLDRGLHWYSRHPIQWLRARAIAKCAQWILDRQEADGSWGGIQPPWVYSLLALHLIGYPLEHPAMVAGLAGLEGFVITDDRPDGEYRRLEACQSPVWDTALAVIALSDAGVAGDDPSLVAAADWLMAEEITVHGDWSVQRPRLAPGGWAFEFANDVYPDTDDTAEVLLALHRCALSDRQHLSGAIGRGIEWTQGMQCKDGGWASFDADNTHTLATKLPFCDFGAVIDPPSADVTAHIIEMLATVGRSDDAATRRGVQWLLAAQESDGSWFGRWGANFIYGTGAAVPALVAAGLPPEHPAILRATNWLIAHQNPDGGWGEDLRSYRDPSWAGRGHSTASQTAWALLALHAAGGRFRAEGGGSPSDAAVTGGVRWLLDTQQANGCWDEPYYTGTGFPGDFYINYHLYRIVFPVSALGRLLAVSADGS